MSNNLDSQDEYGNTKLMNAIYWGNYSLFKRLIHSNANVDLQDNYKTTALIKAVKGGKTKFVKKLLLSKANTKLKYLSGETALELAIHMSYLEFNKYSEIIKMLMKVSYLDDIDNNITQETANLIRNEYTKVLMTEVETEPTISEAFRNNFVYDTIRYIFPFPTTSGGHHLIFESIAEYLI